MNDLLRRLADIAPGDLPFLSIYLDVRPEAPGERPGRRAGFVVFEDRMREIRRTYLPRGANLDSWDSGQASEGVRGAWRRRARR